MKKVPSYPKITTKTNITVMQTQNININSPKSITVGFPNNKKIFKAPKNSTEKVQEPQVNMNSSKPKPKHHFSKPNLSNVRRQSSGNLNKVSKINESKDDSNFQQLPTNKQDIKKIEEKLKQLQKKIDTLKFDKKKKKQLSSQRSHSKIKDNRQTIMDKKPTLSTFGKKKGGSINKILKKTQSDKYLIKPPNHKKQGNRHDLTSSKKDESQLIHKFVTQVVRSDIPDKKYNQKMHNENFLCYYIESVMQCLQKNYLLPFKEHLVQSVQTLKYLQNNRKPSLKQLQKHSILLPPSKFKYTLILDLDETLIHCNQNITIPHDVTLKIKFPTGEKIDAGVNIRPYATDLLKELSQKCEIIVFTASHQCYANVVIDHLDPKREYVSHRLFRPQCWHTQQGVYIKDLRVLKNRNLQNMLLVDNAAYSYLYQLQNGIPILPFYQDKDDEQLLHLVRYISQLITIHEHNNEGIKDFNHKYFHLSSYISCENMEKLVGIYKQNVVKHRELFI